jgi:hypothetical protein
LSEVSDTRNEIVADWESDLNNGNFYVEVENLSDNTVQNNTESYTTYQSTFSGINDGEEYEIRVRSETLDVTGSFVSITVRSYIPIPRIIRTVYTKDQNIKIEWEKIDSFDGGIFKLYRSNSQGQVGSKVAEFDDTTTTYLDDDVEPMKDYYYTIRRVIG